MNNKRELIFHAFNWDIKAIIENLLDIKKANFTAIQISPIQKCKQGDEWWKLYQCLSFSEIGNRLGTEEDLIELTKRANELDIKIIVDLVINHVAGNDRRELEPHEDVDKEILNLELEKQMLENEITKKNNELLSVKKELEGFKND